MAGVIIKLVFFELTAVESVLGVSAFTVIGLKSPITVNMKNVRIQRIFKVGTLKKLILVYRDLKMLHLEWLMLLQAFLVLAAIIFNT